MMRLDWPAVRAVACSVLGMVLAALSLSSPARAVCVFFDGAGVAHLASSALDSRFTCWADGDSATLAAGPGHVRMHDRRVPGKTDDLRSLLLGMSLSTNHARLKPVLRQAARESGVDVELLQAVIAVESGFEPAARSPRGAIGLMQITAETAQRYARGAERQIDLDTLLLDPKANIRIGARMLADLTRRYGRIDAALAAWNAGEGRVRRSGGVPDIPETRAHVHMVLELYWVLLQERQAKHSTQVRFYPATASDVRPMAATATGAGSLAAPMSPASDAATPPAAAAPAPAGASAAGGLAAPLWLHASSRLSLRRSD